MLVSTQSDDFFAHSHLFSCHIHVPDDDPPIWAAGDEVMSEWSIAQALNFVPEGETHKQRILSTNKKPGIFVAPQKNSLTFNFYQFLM